jgi:hypothetical protein
MFLDKWNNPPSGELPLRLRSRLVSSYTVIFILNGS